MWRRMKWAELEDSTLCGYSICVARAGVLEAGKENGHVHLKPKEGEQTEGCLLQRKPALTSGGSLSFQPSCLSMSFFVSSPFPSPLLLLLQ